MRGRDPGRGDPELVLVGQIAAAASCISFLVYLRHSDLLLFGDAVAHINIARRIFDSLTPGITQLGTVWLPLPHIAILPFVVSDRLWQTGVGGSIPSMAAYVVACVGVFRLLRNTLASGAPDVRVRISAWIGTALFAANPNLLYLEATAMTESLCLCFFVWSLVYFTEFVNASDRASSLLMKSGLYVAGACFTRYDGWFLAAVLFGVLIAIAVRSRFRKISVRELLRFLLLATAGPVIWLAYNAGFYRNVFEFVNGPYSAQAIEHNSSAPWHPGMHNLHVAASYFLKCAQLTVAQGNWGRLWLLVLLAGAGVIIFFERRLWPLLLLWFPLPFYAISIAYAGVPLYVPVWWPFTYYNDRYGVEMLPAFAAMFCVLIYHLFRFWVRPKAIAAVAFAAVALVAIGYAFVWRAQPVSFREAWANSRTRIPFEHAMASNLKLLPHDSTLIMYIGDHSGAVQDSGIPFRRVINEDNQRPWIKPIDPDGFWARALKDPQRYADYVIAIDNDPAARLVNRQALKSLVIIRSLDEPPASFYWTGRPQR